MGRRYGPQRAGPGSAGFVALLARARAFRADMAAQGVHIGVAVADGPLMCPTCEEPWPCKALKQVYPRAGG